jgi:1-acyl-sn-glycerol-3-phosphate acyltransferase
LLTLWPRMIKRLFYWIYTGYAGFVFAIPMLIGVGLSFILPIVLPSERRWRRAFLAYCRFWANTWAKLVGVKIVVQNEEVCVKPNQQCVFVGNHASYGDIIALAAAVKHSFSGVAKMESKNYFLFGHVFKRSSVLVDRKDPESRKKSYIEIKKLAFDYGISVFIFPEGTFSNPDKEVLMPFNSGAFRIAAELNLPIQPIIITHVRDMMPNFKLPLRPCTIYFRYLPPTYTQGCTVEDADKLRAQVWQQIQDALLIHEPLYKPFVNNPPANPHAADL